MTDAQANQIAKAAFIKHEGREMGFESAMPWVLSAIKAGALMGRREAENDARDEARSASTEATWQERQGEDYGSF